MAVGTGQPPLAPLTLSDLTLLIVGRALCFLPDLHVMLIFLNTSACYVVVQFKEKSVSGLRPSVHYCVTHSCDTVAARHLRVTNVAHSCDTRAPSHVTLTSVTQESDTRAACHDTVSVMI